MWSEEPDAAVPTSIVLRDEGGQPFAFRPVRLLRDGALVFLLAEREHAGTLHVLLREGDTIGLVRDEAILRRVAVRLEVLRRAMAGELIEWTLGDQTRSFGVFHRGAVAGRPYLLAADLADPATVLAFEPTADGLQPLEDRLVVLVREQLEEPGRAFEIMGPHLEALTLGLRGESVSITDAMGRESTYQTAGRFFFQDRDLLFLKTQKDGARAAVVEFKSGGVLEAVSDPGLLAALNAHLLPSSGPS